MSFFEVNNKCNGCLACVDNCPAGALGHFDQDNNREILHNMSLCARCGNCWRICPQNAIEFQALLTGQWDTVVQMELIRCSVCDEPIYTVKFDSSLTERLDKNIDHLCPVHKAQHCPFQWPCLRLLQSLSTRPEGGYTLLLPPELAGLTRAPGPKKLPGRKKQPVSICLYMMLKTP